MLAKTNQYVEEVVSTIYQLTQGEKIRQQCEAREDYYRRTAGREELLRKTTQERNEAFAERDQAFTERNQAFAEQERLRTEKERLKRLLEKQRY